MTKWYLIQFKPNSHRLAERNLNRQGFKTFLPMQEVTHRKTTQFVTSRKPLFPGYMFVNLDVATAPWRKINSTLGVSKLVSFGSKPKSLPDELVSALLKRCDEDGIILSPKALKKGDNVELLSGPFASFIATVESIDPEQRVWVLMECMGQSTRIEVTADQVQITS